MHITAKANKQALMRGVGHTHTTDERKNKQCQCTKKVMVVDDGPQPRLAAGNKPMRALTERERERDPAGQSAS